MDISDTVYRNEGTNTSGAIKMMIDDMFKRKNGDRSKAPNIGIVITGNMTHDLNYFI